MCVEFAGHLAGPVAPPIQRIVQMPRLRLPRLLGHEVPPAICADDRTGGILTLDAQPGRLGASYDLIWSLTDRNTKLLLYVTF
jgi:hypothetical protein